MKKVLTLTGADFDLACRRLADSVADSGFYPDVIIGIKTGGDVVGRKVARRFPQARYTAISASRGATASRNGGGRILAHLPYFVTDLLRIAESWVRAMTDTGAGERHIVMEFDPDCREVMNKNGCKVLIIDDAIDSGATIRQARGILLGEFPRCTCKSAVMTVTTSNPVELPEFRLFNNKLIRFPWSTDLRR